MNELNNVLRHSGVRGMKWGVIRNRNRPGGADGRPDASDARRTKRSKLGQHMDSLKRERQWKKVASEIDQMSTKDIAIVTKRIRLENSLKRLSKEVGTSKDKHDYLHRHKMDDQELSRKVTRLSAKESLFKEINTASKTQRELGRRIVDTAGSLAFTYAKSRRIGPLDIFDAVTTAPKPSKDTLKKTALDKIRSELEKREKQKSPPTP